MKKLRESTREDWLRWGLYFIGGTALLALVPVIVPMPWLIRSAKLMNLELDAAPLTNYLARQLSLWYALFGGLLLFLARDIQRYRPLLHALGYLLFCFGATLLAIDYTAGMPLWWTVIEGPRVMVASAILIWLAKEV